MVPAFVHRAVARTPVGLSFVQFHAPRAVWNTDIITVLFRRAADDELFLVEDSKSFVVGEDIPAGKYYGCVVMDYDDGSSEIKGALDYWHESWKGNPLW